MNTKARKSFALFMALLMFFIGILITVSANNPIFIGFDSNFPVAFDIIDYDNGVALVSATPKIAELDIENIFITLNDSDIPPS